MSSFDEWQGRELEELIAPQHLKTLREDTIGHKREEAGIKAKTKVDDATVEV